MIHTREQLSRHVDAMLSQNLDGAPILLSIRDTDTGILIYLQGDVIDTLVGVPRQTRSHLHLRTDQMTNGNKRCINRAPFYFSSMFTGV